MEKKESANKQVASKLAENAQKTTNKIVLILKFILAALAVPLIIGITIAFSKTLLSLESILQNYFLAGIIAYLILHLFIYKPVAVYKTGQGILQFLFIFFAPLVKIASYLLPIYSILITAIYFILAKLPQYKLETDTFLFFISFSFILHLVQTADALRDKQTGLERANYFFAFAIIYLIDIVLLAGMLQLIFNDFSFLEFLSQSGQESLNIYQKVFVQLFP
ncbi:MAG: hypothetical protein AB1629_00690 [Candidatus Omnitrophota bacterium]